MVVTVLAFSLGGCGGGETAAHSRCVHVLFGAAITDIGRTHYTERKKITWW